MSARPRGAAWMSCALALFASAPAAGLEWVPVAKVDALGGQFWFQGENTNFSGNANWMFSPGLKLGPRDALIPIVSGQYRRTREVQELIGGGFLTQEVLDNAVALKWVHLFSERWNIKPVISYKNEMITESKDEVLGKGLFDYHKLSAGFEVERAGPGVFRSVRHGFNAYTIRFYRYSALSSESADLGAEVNSGDRVLDFNAYDYTLSSDIVPRDGTLLTASLLTSARPYRDQKIVTVSGEYLARNRFDVYLSGAVSGRQNLPAWGGLESVAGLNLSYTRLLSDQANYDAQNTRYNPGYYDYWETASGPFVAARWRKKLTVSAAYDYTRRAYDRRPIQDESGLYGDKAIRMDTHTVSFSASYPTGWRKLSLKAQGAYRRSTSNMLYESSYRYNYWSAYYFAGVGWEL
jgi:hypothetical protein